MKKHFAMLFAVLLLFALAALLPLYSYAQATCPSTDSGCVSGVSDSWVVFQSPTVVINAQDQVAVHVGSLTTLPCVTDGYGGGPTCNIELVSYPKGSSLPSIDDGWPDYPSCYSAGVNPSTQICTANTITGWYFCGTQDPANPDICTLVTNPTAMTPPYQTDGDYYYGVFVQDSSSGNCPGYYSGAGTPDCLQGSGELVVTLGTAPYLTIGGPSTAPGIESSSQNQNTFTALPGTSAYLNYLYQGAQCNPETFIELSAPGSACIPPDSLSHASLNGYGAVSVYCNEDLAGTNMHYSVPYCIIPYGYAHNSCIVPPGYPDTSGIYGPYYSYANLYAPGISYNALNNEENPDYATYLAGANSPWPVCIADFAWLDEQTAGLGSFCNIAYYTNSTLQQGNYSICGYYQPVAYDVDGNPYTITTQQAPSLNYLNITSNDIEGPSYGLYVANSLSTFQTSASASEELSIVANTQSDSPFSAFYSSGSDGSEPSASDFCNALSANGLCVMELASAAPGNGCVAPEYPQTISISGGTEIVSKARILPYCNPAVNTNLPCLLTQEAQTPTIDEFSAYLPGSFFQPSNSYVVCGYYYMNAKYPAETTSFFSGGPTGPLSIFFASANITCGASGTCDVGVSDQQQPAQGVTPNEYLQTAQGSIAINPSTLPWTASSTETSSVVAVANGVSNTADLYIAPFVSTSTTFLNFADACASASSSATSACTGSASDTSGCYMSFLPNTITDAQTGNCMQTAGSDSGYLSGASCFCTTNYVPAGCTAGPGADQVTCPSSCTANPQTGVITCSGGTSGTGTVVLNEQPSDSCTITVSSPEASEFTEPSPLQPAQYLYCESYQGGFVAGGFLNVVSYANGQQFLNRGNVIVTPLTTELCSVYSQITQSLLVFSFIILLLGAIFYESATLLPSQLRGTLQGYAMGMLLGGILGAVIVGASAFAVSTIANIPIQSILLPSACSIPYTTANVAASVP